MRHRRQGKHGHYLYKRALFKVFVGKRVFKIPFIAKPGQGLSAADIEKFEERVIDHIDTTFSRLEFRRVVLAPNMVNFIACGQKATLGEKKDEILGTSRCGTEEEQSTTP